MIKYIVILREHVNYCIQCMIARSCHPLSFLKHKMHSEHTPNVIPNMIRRCQRCHWIMGIKWTWLIWVKILQRNSMMNVFSKVVVLARTYKPCIKNDKLSDSLSLCFHNNLKNNNQSCLRVCKHFKYTSTFYLLLFWIEARSVQVCLPSMNKAWLNGCNILRIQVQVICFWKDPDVHSNAWHGR